MDEYRCFVPEQAASASDSRCSKKTMLPHGMDLVILRQKRHPLLAIAIEELSNEPSYDRLLEEITINQVNHFTIIIPTRLYL